MKPKMFGGAVNTRRVNALNRLQEQIKSGVKPVCSTKNAFVAFNATETLTPTDVIRIKKEINILQSRITSEAAAAQRRTKKYRGGSGFTR